LPRLSEPVERVLGRFNAGPLNLRHVGYFLVTCEEMHFGRASLRLRIAQPALSQQIKRLETFVGVSLFNRNRRGIELTEAGLVFRDYALQLSKQVEEAKRASQRAQLGETGKITVGLIPSGNNSFVLERVARYRQAHADVEIVISSMVTTRQVEAIVSGRIDVGFVRLPIRHHEIDVRKIHSEAMVVALPKKHRLAKAARIRLADVAKEDLVIFPREIAPSYFDYIISLFRMAGHELKIRQQIEHAPIILALIAHGFGFTLVPASQQAYGHDDVVFKPLEETTPFIEMGMIVRADNRSPLLASLLDMFPVID
jgi:DNA-binding transcriptional LysR family regulator